MSARIAYDVGPPRGDDDVQALAEVLAVSFNAPAERILENFEAAGGAERLRVVRHGDDVVGGLLLIAMGQWFGGRSVPQAGVSIVGVEPAFRGRGAGRALIEETVRGLHADGVPLSTLYPATVPVYRAAGYELAGSRWDVRVGLKGLPTRSAPSDAGGPLDVRRAGDDDLPAMVAAQESFARLHAGTLHRDDFIWRRVRNPRRIPAHHHVVEEDGAITGLVSFIQTETADGFYDLAVSDVAALTTAAADRLLAFLGTHQSMAGAMHLQLPPHHALLARLPEWRAKAKLQLPWMARLAHVDAALAARGWPAGVVAELHLDVADDVVPANAGRRVLRVADGRATVEPGGAGSLRVDVRGLAALFTGFRTPDALRLQGLLDGPPEDRALAASAFAGPDPWMMEMF